MGTPEFAVAPLKRLLDDGYNVSAVVTGPDKPAGRGLKPRMSAVKEFALQHDLPVLQPEKLKDPDFIESLRSLSPDIIIVVAFRMLPTEVWTIPPLGTFNLHASLLPQYRGAAPINRAIMNGEEITGVTTFLLNQNIDTGNILLQKEVVITDNDNAGSLHDKLMESGSALVSETVHAIIHKNIQPVAQDSLTENTELKPAPKIFREDCLIHWNAPSMQIYNQIRGLSPYPAAYTTLQSPDGRSFQMKVFKTSVISGKASEKPGNIDTDGRTFVSIATADSWINLEEIQLEAKKKMRIDEFLRGFPMDRTWKTT